LIRYALQCEHDHAFEAWFSSSSDYDDQAARGLVECPFCASPTVRKAIMAPAVHGTRRDAPAADPAQAARMQTMMMEAMVKVREHVEENFDYVGDAFAREARAIHDGEAENRGIYGQATAREVRDLHADGVQVAPLPPAATPRPKTQVN
jgi:hypothetical protein